MKNDIENSKWMSPCCGNTPILKSSIFNENNLIHVLIVINTEFPPKQRFDHLFGKNYEIN